MSLFVLVNSALQDSEKYVEELLTLFNRFSKLVKEAFNDDPRFLTARDKVFLPLLEAWVVVVKSFAYQVAHNFPPKDPFMRLIHSDYNYVDTTI